MTYLRYPRTPVRGYTLLEMLLYVAVLAMGVNLCMALFVTGSRLSAVTTQQLDRMNGLAEVQQEFREAVRRAEGVVPRLGSYESNPGQLILRCPSKDGAARYILLGALRDADRLSRFELSEENGVLKPEKFSTYALPVTALAFEWNASGLVQMDLRIKKDAGERDKNPITHRAIAALRGMARAGEGAQP